MARLMSPADVVTLCFSLWPSHRRQVEKIVPLDQWHRGEQLGIKDPDLSGTPFVPRNVAPGGEIADMQSRVPTNWAGFLVRTMAQTCSLEGMYLPGSNETLQTYRAWQENRWDAQQIPLYRSVLAHGFAYAVTLPGKSTFTGNRMARWTTHSALKMSAVFAEPEDEFPLYALQAEKRVAQNGQTYYQVTFYDEQAVHYLEVDGEGQDVRDWHYISPELVHDLGFTPVVQYHCEKDLDGRINGEIEPVIPLLRRIDQDVFDRLTVQRFGAWVVRYGTGLVKPETDEERRAQALLLRMGELLVSSDPQSKFGTLPATDLGGFIAAHDADLRILSAVAQRPPHHMLGLSSNMQAESLAATEQGLQRRGHEFRTGVGESHELLFRASAVILGNRTEADAYDMQSRWRDNESRSLAQTADALGKLATQLGVPVELLWERIPGWTDSDTERAKKMAQLEGVALLLDQVAKQQAAPPAPTDPGSPVA